MWLAFQQLDKNPLGISPGFHIDSRIATKDRALWIYPLSKRQIGLSIVGANSLIFRLAPSCFALVINGVCLVNASTDFMISARAGFPFPTKTYLDLDSGKMSVEQFKVYQRVKHPLFTFEMFDAAIFVFQPIPLKDLAEENPELYSGPYFDSMLMRSRPSLGKIISSSQRQTRVFSDESNPIPFEEIPASRSKPLYEIDAQVLRLQNFLFESGPRIFSQNEIRLKETSRFFSLSLSENKRTSRRLIQLGREGKLAGGKQNKV